MKIKCMVDGCDKTHGDRAYEKVLAFKAGWFHQENGNVYCPNHNPPWGKRMAREEKEMTEEIDTVPADITELIERRRRQVLVHSILYYKMNTNIISDHQYDSLARQLAQLQLDYPTESAKVEYHLEAFKGFTGDTGFDLPLHDKAAIKLAKHLKADSEKPKKVADEESAWEEADP